MKTYLRSVADSERDDRPAVGVSLEVSVPQPSDVGKEVTRLFTATGRVKQHGRTW